MTLILTTETNPGEAQWSDASGLSSPPQPVVWRPGGTTEASQNIFAAFADARDAAAGLTKDNAAVAQLYVDTSEGAAVIPAGTFDMDHIQLVGDVSEAFGGFTEVTTSVGTVFTNWNYGMKDIALLHGGSGPLFTYNSPETTVIHLGTHCDVATLEHPVFQASDGVLIAIAEENYTLQAVAEGGEVVGTADAGAVLSFVLGAGGQVGDDVLTGAGTVVLTYLSGYTANPGLSQAGVGGTFTFNQPNFAYTPDDPGAWADPDPTELIDAVDRLAQWIKVNGGGPLP